MKTYAPSVMPVKLAKPESMKPKTKPPLGAMPRRLFTEGRVADLSAAISRYAKVGEPIPDEWLEELALLTDWLRKSRPVKTISDTSYPIPDGWRELLPSETLVAGDLCRTKCSLRAGGSPHGLWGWRETRKPGATVEQVNNARISGRHLPTLVYIRHKG